ncbi:hypothetical protein AaE_015967 [Aphanomyces astaci]|uniref:Uncharacterized protein n=1 Tax=Aphanomyces astaci TaxID=112090 RepID=A0A6A4Z0I0_APHAT|nr:hypothetical protein AaE_015967 [Aphanomyces astaci]
MRLRNSDDSRAASAAAMYSASQLESAVMRWRTLLPPRNDHKNPMVDQRSGRVVQLASQYPPKVGPPVPNWMPYVLVPDRYRRTHLAPSRCGVREAWRWQDRRCTAWAMSVRMQTIRYTKDPIIARSSWSKSGVAVDHAKSIKDVCALGHGECRFVHVAADSDAELVVDGTLALEFDLGGQGGHDLVHLLLGRGGSYEIFDIRAEDFHVVALAAGEDACALRTRGLMVTKAALPRWVTCPSGVHCIMRRDMAMAQMARIDSTPAICEKPFKTQRTFQRMTLPSTSVLRA